MVSTTHEQLKKFALKRPGIRKAYDALQNEFDLLEEMVKTRLKVGKTQEDIAKAMNTTLL